MIDNDMHGFSGAHAPAEDDDIHGLSGAYAVDAVDDDERARFETHLAACSACQSEVMSLCAAAGELASGSLASPPASLRASVLSDIASVRPLPPLIDAPGSPTSLESGRAKRAERVNRLPGRWLAGVAAAAAIVTGGVVLHPWSPGQVQGNVQLSATQQVLQADDAQTFEKKVGDGTTKVVRSPSLNKAVIVTTNMPAPPKGKVYELWLQQGPTMVKAGFVPQGPSSTVLLQGDAATADGAGITIEPAGGSITPSDPPVALISFA